MQITRVVPVEIAQTHALFYLRQAAVKGWSSASADRCARQLTRSANPAIAREARRLAEILTVLKEADSDPWVA